MDNNQQPEPALLNEGENEESKSNPRYNWDALKIEFLQGPWKTVAEFARDKKIPQNQNSSVKMRGWGKEKMDLVAETIKDQEGELVEITPEHLERVRQRQAEHGRTLQKKGLLALEVLEPKTIDDARKLIVAGMQEERAALGISEKGGGPSSLTQYNVNLPKTKFDTLLNDQDFAGVLKLIAAIKKERARRSGELASPEGKATAK